MITLKNKRILKYYLIGNLYVHATWNMKSAWTSGKTYLVGKSLINWSAVLLFRNGLGDFVKLYRVKGIVKLLSLVNF